MQKTDLDSFCSNVISANEVFLKKCSLQPKFQVSFSSSRWAKRFSDKQWIFVCEEETRVNLTRIETMLERYDPSKVIRGINLMMQGIL